MKLFTHALDLLIHFMIFLYRKIGINGILIFILVIELPIALSAFDKISSRYRYSSNYVVDEVTDIREIPYSEVPDSMKGSADPESKTYYLVSIPVTNYSNNDEYSLWLHGNAENGDSFFLDEIQYYDNTSEYSVLRADALIPSGAANELQFIFSLRDYQLSEISSITITPSIDHETPWFLEKESDKTSAVSVRLPK